MLIQFTRNTPKPIPSIPKHSIWLLSSAYFVSFVPAIRVHSLFCHRFWFGAGTPLFIVYNTLSQYTMLSNESINFRNVAFCVRIYLYFFVYDEAAFFRIEWDAMSVFTGQQKSDNKNIWTASLIVSLQLLWKKNDVSTNCTVGLYMFDLFLRRNLLCWFGWFFFPTSCKGFLWREQLKYRSCENDCLIWISLCANVHVLCKRECSCLIIKQFEMRRFDL